MQKKRDMIMTVVFVIILLVGLSVMLYPTFSDWWNQNKASHSISVYKDSVAEMNDDDTEQYLQAAYDYNERIANQTAPFSTYDEVDGYEDTLNVSGSGIMGYVSIPCINVELPIYHGTEDSVLQIASGHVQGSSLPVGGPSSHAVISGHRGLPSAKLFTDLDHMNEGDVFTIHVLNDVLTYQVEKILVVLPTQLEELAIVPGKDYVTLVTCTPYGINSHRLLVRGKRIDTIYENHISVNADAMQLDNMTVICTVLIPLLIALVLYWFISGKRNHGYRIDKYLIDKLPRRKD